MYFNLDENSLMIGYSEDEPSEGKFIECDHFADSALLKPKWDYDSEDWVEGITADELAEMQAEQDKNRPLPPETAEEIHVKLDRILELLEK